MNKRWKARIDIKRNMRRVDGEGVWKSERQNTWMTDIAEEKNLKGKAFVLNEISEGDG